MKTIALIIQPRLLRNYQITNKINKKKTLMDEIVLSSFSTWLTIWEVGSWPNPTLLVRNNKKEKDGLYCDNYTTVASFFSSQCISISCYGEYVKQGVDYYNSETISFILSCFSQHCLWSYCRKDIFWYTFRELSVALRWFGACLRRLNSSVSARDGPHSLYEGIKNTCFIYLSDQTGST